MTVQQPNIDNTTFPPAKKKSLMIKGDPLANDGYVTIKVKVGSIILTPEDVKKLGFGLLNNDNEISTIKVQGSFTEQQMEMAWENGVDTGEQRGGEFDIEDYI